MRAITTCPNEIQHNSVVSLPRLRRKVTSGCKFVHGWHFRPYQRKKSKFVPRLRQKSAETRPSTSICTTPAPAARPTRICFFARLAAWHDRENFGYTCCARRSVCDLSSCGTHFRNWDSPTSVTRNNSKCPKRRLNSLVGLALALAARMDPVLVVVAWWAFFDFCYAEYPQRISLFFVGPGPFLLLVLHFSAFGQNVNLAGRFADRRLWVLVVFVWLFPLFVDSCTYTATELCTFLAFTTSASVRTKPQATSAAPEEK